MSVLCFLNAKYYVRTRGTWNRKKCFSWAQNTYLIHTFQFQARITNILHHRVFGKSFPTWKTLSITSSAFVLPALLGRKNIRAVFVSVCLSVGLFVCLSTAWELEIGCGQTQRTDEPNLNTHAHAAWYKSQQSAVKISHNQPRKGWISAAKISRKTAAQ